jgi:uncharacterized coiled-coil protein SlyX
MYKRKFEKEILKRLDKLEDKYILQESQVKNLLHLFKEYHGELDRRKKAYSALMQKSAALGVFMLLVIPFT